VKFVNKKSGIKAGFFNSGKQPLQKAQEFHQFRIITNLAFDTSFGILRRSFRSGSILPAPGFLHPEC